MTHASFGIGFIVGPAIGGIIGSKFGYHVPSFIAAFLSLLNLIGIIFFLEESHQRSKKEGDKTQKNCKLSLDEWVPIEEIKRVSKDKKMLKLFVIKFLQLFIFTLFRSTIGIFCEIEFRMQAKHNGFLIAYVGIVYSLVQGGFLLKRFREETLIFSSFITSSLACLLWWRSADIYSLILAVTIFSLPAGILQTSINTLITLRSRQSDLGLTLGLSASVGSLTRFLAPLISGFLISSFGHHFLGLFCGVLCIIALLFVDRIEIKEKE